jgi:hypothetical protein
MQTAATLAVAILLLAVPAAAQQPVPPDAAGVWGFAYEDLRDSQLAQEVVQRDAISCLAEPTLTTTEGEEYKLSVYRIDPRILSAGQLRYFIVSESLCTYDPTTGIETCRRIDEPTDETAYRTYYEPLDTGAGIYRGHAFDTELQVEEFTDHGSLPGGYTFVTFLCPATQQPRLQLLNEAQRNKAEVEAVYDALDEGYRLCGYPVCGEAAERLHTLTTK